jgi:predicted nucleic acid-binding protein
VRLALVLANRFKDTPEITEVLTSVIRQATSEAFMQRLFNFATDKQNNQIFENWEHVNFEALKEAFATRMNARYRVGGEASIYGLPSGTWREWQSLVTWSRISDAERENVKNYLEDEFERRPASIGKHLLWLNASINNVEGVKVVDALFPLSKLAALAEKYGEKSYSNDSERNAVNEVITKYGGSSGKEPESGGTQ